MHLKRYRGGKSREIRLYRNKNSVKKTFRILNTDIDIFLRG